MSIRCHSCYGVAVLFDKDRYWCSACAWRETRRSEKVRAGLIDRRVDSVDDAASSATNQDQRQGGQ